MTPDLKRFVEAQQERYEIALSELKNGQKRSHWMWYIFPQIAGLGYSETARYFAIGSPDDSKFRSSMTLFEYYASDEPLFANALERYCDGYRDNRTLQIIRTEFC